MGRKIAAAEPGRLDRYVRERILSVMDHKDLNTDVAGFRGVPTTENLVFEIERRLRAGWTAHFANARLDRIWVQETPRNTIELRSR